MYTSLFLPLVLNYLEYIFWNPFVVQDAVARLKARKENGLQNLPDRKLNIRFSCLKVLSVLPSCTLYTAR